MWIYLNLDRKSHISNISHVRIHCYTFLRDFNKVPYKNTVFFENKEHSHHFFSLNYSNIDSTWRFQRSPQIPSSLDSKRSSPRTWCTGIVHVHGATSFSVGFDRVFRTEMNVSRRGTRANFDVRLSQALCPARKCVHIRWNGQKRASKRMSGMFRCAGLFSLVLSIALSIASNIASRTDPTN